MSDALPVINSVYKLYRTVVDLNAKMPKVHRHSLGQSLDNSVLELMENLIKAKNAPRPHKASYLIDALTQQEVATLKLRLYLDMKLANETKIFQAQSELQEIGRMAGGWLKSLGSPQK